MPIRAGAFQKRTPTPKPQIPGSSAKSGLTGSQKSAPLRASHTGMGSRRIVVLSTWSKPGPPPPGNGRRERPALDGVFVRQRLQPWCVGPAFCALRLANHDPCTRTKCPERSLRVRWELARTQSASISKFLETLWWARETHRKRSFTHHQQNRGGAGSNRSARQLRWASDSPRRSFPIRSMTRTQLSTT
jgi:hypothetical protein